METKAAFEEFYWTAPDGLRLHARDYAGAKDRLPVICIPGLTRNARDFAHVAERLAGTRRVLCVELRGRGESSWSGSAGDYAPPTYLLDLLALLDDTGIKRAILIGTSLGGLMTMMLAAARPGLVRGALLNDIGPVIEAAGLQRIRSYVGKAPSWPTWVHAARDLEEQQRQIYPDYDLQRWIVLAKRLFKLSPQGRIVPDYDPRIAEPMRENAAPADPDLLWTMYESLGDVPVTVLRGGLSDILSAKTAREMARRLPAARQVTVANVGHAPALDEPAAQRAIDALLKAVGK